MIERQYCQLSLVYIDSMILEISLIRKQMSLTAWIATKALNKLKFKLQKPEVWFNRILVKKYI